MSVLQVRGRAVEAEPLRTTLCLLVREEERVRGTLRATRILVVAVPGLVDGQGVGRFIESARGGEAVAANGERLELVAGTEQRDDRTAFGRVIGHARGFVAVGRVDDGKVEACGGNCVDTIAFLVNQVDVLEGPRGSGRSGTAARSIVAGRAVLVGRCYRDGREEGAADQHLGILRGASSIGAC